MVTMACLIGYNCYNIGYEDREREIQSKPLLFQSFGKDVLRVMKDEDTGGYVVRIFDESKVEFRR